MQQQNIPIGTLVDMYKRGELRLPEIQRHYVWKATGYLANIVAKQGAEALTSQCVPTDPELWAIALQGLPAAAPGGAGRADEQLYPGESQAMKLLHSHWRDKGSAA